MAFQGITYARFKYGTVPYAWTTSLSLTFIEGIPVADTWSYHEDLGFNEIIRLQEWISIKLDSTPWAAASDSSTVWLPTTPASGNNPWTEQ